MNFQRHLASPAALCGLLIGLVFLSASFSGCATIKEKRLEKENLTLIYRHKSALGSEIEKMNLDHPVKISEQEVRNHLLSLRYEELSLLGKGRYVYSPGDVDEITRLITKAIQRLSPENVVYFEWETPGGSTVAEIFAAEGRLNWRLEKIRGVEFSSGSFPGWRGSTWRLVPKAGQHYHVSKNLIGKTTRENWIVANLVLPKRSNRKLKKTRSSKSHRPSPARSEPPAAQGISSENARELGKKLEILKDWREKNLIDEEEYQRKRKELLDTFL